MPKSIHDYCASNPIPKHHQKAGEKTAMKRSPMSAGWAWKPDATTEAALARGARKRRKAQHQPEETTMATKKAKAKKTSTRKGGAHSAKKPAVKKKVAKKVASNGKQVPLKKLCQELKIDPRLARRKLRAAKLQGHDPKARWEFTPAQAKKARKVLAA